MGVHGDRGGGDAQQFTDLRVRHALDPLQVDRGPLPVGQRGDRVQHGAVLDDRVQVRRASQRRPPLLLQQQRSDQ
jgi:hypothetical protein